MFIAVDLKVIEGLADSVARAAGVSADRILAGLVRLWHRCWADEIDRLDRLELSGVFGFDAIDAIIAALVAFGFLVLEAMTWRVKGAARYLRLKESRRRGAAATNALKSRSRASHKSRSRASLSDAQSRSLTESPNTESPNTEEKHLRAKKPPAPANPRLTDLTLALVDDYANIRNVPYKHGGAKDAVALKALLPVAEDIEIRRRWIQGLEGQGWLQVSTFAQLAHKWNDLKAPQTQNYDPNQGIIRHA